MSTRDAPFYVWETVDALLNGDPVTPSDRNQARAYFAANANKERNNWDLYCGSFGLRPEQFGSTFTSRGTEFTVIGLTRNGRKYPVLAQNARGTRYKFPARSLG